MSCSLRCLIASLAVVVTITALWFSNRAVTPKKATYQEVKAEARAAGYRLISTGDLAEIYKKKEEKDRIKRNKKSLDKLIKNTLDDDAITGFLEIYGNSLDVFSQKKIRLAGSKKNSRKYDSKKNT